MTQIIVTHKSKDQQEVTFEIDSDGVAVKWPGAATSLMPSSGIFVAWEDMEDPEVLCEIFGHMRVEHFVQLTHWLANAYQKRELYQQLG